MSILLAEFDPDRRAIIEPEMLNEAVADFPQIALSCFSKALLDKYLALFQGEEIARLHSEDGGIPIYRIDYEGLPVAVYMSRVGAPAAVIQMEAMIAKGAKQFLILGCCGVLDREIPGGHIILPTAAIRDEGTSYHYLEPAVEIAMQTEAVQLLAETLQDLNYPYVQGKTWTTDGFYRETREKMARRKAQGCIAVDMECASLHAVAEFRQVFLAQFFYTEDNLDSEEWDRRELGNASLKRQEEFLRLPFACLKRMAQRQAPGDG